MRSREATEPRPVWLTVSRAPGNADLTNSTVPSVHPSAVTRISSGAGARRRSTSHVRRRSSTRFLVVIMMEVVKDKTTRLRDYETTRPLDYKTTGLLNTKL